MRRFLFLVLFTLLVAGCSDSESSFTGPAGPIGGTTQADGALVVSSGGSLVQLDRNGQILRTLTSGHEDVDPDFHPADTLIVFSRRSATGGPRDIFVMNPDGSQPINLTEGFEFDAFDPGYSPDGAMIVFSAQLSPGVQNLFLMDSDGGNVRPLTTGSFHDTNPAFSTGSDKVVFERAAGANSKICKISLDGGPVIDLTDGLHLDITPSYCPPEDRIVFTRDGDLVSMADNHQPGDTAGLNFTPNLGLEASHPEHDDESDDFFFIATPSVSSRGDQGSELWAVDPDGSDLRLLSDNLEPPLEGLAKRVKAFQAARKSMVNVEIVNDSGLADKDVFLLLNTPEKTGQVVEPSGTLSLLTDSGTASGKAVALSGLNQSKEKIQSSHTGAELPIYTVVVKNLVSGQFLFSYNQAVEIKNGASPTANTGLRFDKMEITYEGGPMTGGGNLTSIDFYGIPIQVEVFHPGEDTPDPIQTKSFYASTPTMLAKLSSLGLPASGAGWTKDLSGAAFPISAGLTNFARIMAPGTLAGEDQTAASSSPYPSFQSYLASLEGQTFTFNGKQHGGYQYKVKFQSDGNGGFDAVCTGTLDKVDNGQGMMVPVEAPPAGVPVDAKVTAHFPAPVAGTATEPALSMDWFIYACVANKFSYTIDGFAFTDADRVKAGNDSAYGALVGDIQAALNFGYVGGVFGASNIDSLFFASVLPYPYPYGGSRGAMDDGFYDPYAAILYYLSDAYGHPYSDRLDAASPLYSLAPEDTIRITLLNDTRLDAPLVSVSGETNTSLNLSWDAVPGATGYTVRVTPPRPGVVHEVPSTDTTISLTDLDPGTPYFIYVQATGTRNSKQVSSTAVPVQGVTTGTRTPITGGPIGIDMNLNLDNNLPDKNSYSVFINGSPVSPTANAAIQANIGTNVVGVKIDGPTGTVYQGNYYLTLVDTTSPGSSNKTFRIGKPFELEFNRTPLSIASGQPGPDYPYQGSGLVVGTPFVPKPYYKFFETVFP